MSLSDQLKREGLLDPFNREHAVGTMHDWVKYPEQNPPAICAKVMQEQIVEPLIKWLEDACATVEGNANNYVHIESGQVLMNYADDLVYRFKHNLTVVPEHISVFDEKWKEFQIHIGWGAIFDELKTREERSRGGRQKKRDPYILEAIVAIMEMLGGSPSPSQIKDWIENKKRFVLKWKGRETEFYIQDRADGERYLCHNGGPEAAAGALPFKNIYRYRDYAKREILHSN